VPVPRSIREHPLWGRQRFTGGQALVDLLLRAAYADHPAIRGNRAITVKAGQILTSQVELAKAWGWNRGTVPGFLRLLENLGIVAAIVTSKATDTGYTLITLRPDGLIVGSSSDASSIGASIPSGNGHDTGQASGQHRAYTSEQGREGKQRREGGRARARGSLADGKRSNDKWQGIPPGPMTL
jgi:hypothetical protein